MMLRIYIHDEVPVTSIVAEGKLVGPWVKELEKCWETVVAAHPRKSMVVDLVHVTFIDSEGRALLTRIRQKGARLLSSGVLINSIVADIEAQHEVMVLRQISDSGALTAIEIEKEYSSPNQASTVRDTQ